MALIVWLLLPALGWGAERVELSVRKTLQLDSAAVDVAVSPDGKQVYVLNDKGVLVIYSATGEAQSAIDVGKHIDQVTVGAKGQVLILNSRRDKTVQLVDIETINEIDISGSPVKGRADAPVVVAVFSDFQ